MMTQWNFLLVMLMCLLTTSKADWLRELQSGRTISVGDGVKVRVDRIADGVNQTSYFSSHVLRVFLGDVGLSLAEAKGKEGLQIDLFTPRADGNTEARGDANVFSVVLPLLIGFKIAGSILTTLVAVLIVSLKAFLAALVALLLTGAGAVKKLMGHEIPAEIHYPMSMEYYSHPHHPGHPPTGYDYPSASGYNAAPHSAHSPHSAPSAMGPSAHESGPSAAESNVSAQYVAATANGSVAQGVRRRIYRRRKPVPIITMSKITRKEEV